MNPTQEQLKDPQWAVAPEDATHLGGDLAWYKIDSDSSAVHTPHGWMEVLDLPSEMQKRPTHSVDATENVTGQKYDQGKPMMSLIPPRAEMAVAEVLTFGANKYGSGNWRHVEDLERRYTDAARRHLNAYQQGEKLDDESGLPHLAHAICCLMFMLEKDLEQ